MKTRSKQTEYFKKLLHDLKNKNDKISLLWSLTNSKKINRRQFKELILKQIIMPDITMCNGDGCPLKRMCFRHNAKPSQRQSYFMESPYDGEKCDQYVIDYK